MKSFEAPDVCAPLFVLSPDEAGNVAIGLTWHVQEELACTRGVENVVTAKLDKLSNRFETLALEGKSIVVGGRELEIVYLGLTAASTGADKDAIAMLYEAILEQTDANPDQSTGTV